MHSNATDEVQRLRAALAAANARAEAEHEKGTEWQRSYLASRDAWLKQHATIAELREELRITQNAGRQAAALSREYSAMQERTQRHAQDMEAAMLRWQQRAEAAEAVRLAVIKRNGELHNQVHRLKQQCGDLEAKLAAVPVEALRRYMRYSQVPEHHHRYDAAEQQADESAIGAWLAQQSEARP